MAMDPDEERNAAHKTKPYLLPDFQETKKNLTDIECVTNLWENYKLATKTLSNPRRETLVTDAWSSSCGTRR